jgi:hypothetical protein
MNPNATQALVHRRGDDKQKLRSDWTELGWCREQLASATSEFPIPSALLANHLHRS